jgi:hypothetical protein
MIVLVFWCVKRNLSLRSKRGNRVVMGCPDLDLTGIEVWIILKLILVLVLVDKYVFIQKKIVPFRLVYSVSIVIQ